MSITAQLETAKMSPPLAPTLPVDTPIELVLYMQQMQDYMQALHRDIKKLGDAV